MGVLQEVSGGDLVPRGVRNHGMPSTAPLGCEHVVIGRPHEVHRQRRAIDDGEVSLLLDRVSRHWVVRGDAHGKSTRPGDSCLTQTRERSVVSVLHCERIVRVRSRFAPEFLEQTLLRDDALRRHGHESSPVELRGDVVAEESTGTVLSDPLLDARRVLVTFMMQKRVHDDEARESLRHGGVLSQPDWPAPVLDEQGDISQVEVRHQPTEVPAVAGDVVPPRVGDFVTSAEANVIGCDAAVAGGQ